MKENLKNDDYGAEATTIVIRRHDTERCKALISSTVSIRLDTTAINHKGPVMFYRLIRRRLTSNKVIERSKCGRRTDLLIQP